MQKTQKTASHNNCQGLDFVGILDNLFTQRCGKPTCQSSDIHWASGLLQQQLNTNLQQSQPTQFVYLVCLRQKICCIYRLFNMSTSLPATKVQLQSLDIQNLTKDLENCHTHNSHRSVTQHAHMSPDFLLPRGPVLHNEPRLAPRLQAAMSKNALWPVDVHRLAESKTRLVVMLPRIGFLFEGNAK